MSATLDALEVNAKALIVLTNKIIAENAQLQRENKKLNDQLDDALDEVHKLQIILRELRGEVLP